MWNMEELPDLPLKRLVEYLDYASRKTCRLVSRRLKFHVENIGLAIQIDSRQAESMNLCQNVAVTEARIVYLEASELEIEAEMFLTWRIAVISCPVEGFWLNERLLRNCHNLRVLIFNEDSLKSEDFKSPSESIHYFQHLRELHINLNKHRFRNNISVENLDTAIEDMRTRVQKNVAYVLTTVRSRVLKLLLVSVYVPDPTVHGGDSWEYQPFLEFLQHHRHSLDTVILHSLAFQEAVGRFDVQLKRISLAPHALMIPKALPGYWTNLLLSQHSLEKVAIGLHAPGIPAEPFPWLPALLRNNTRTLSDIYLALFDVGNNQDEGEPTPGPRFTLDMRIFSSMKCLKSLQLKTYYQAVKIVNINDLPTRSLTKLELVLTLIGDDFDGIRFLESCHPKTLNLSYISAEGFFKDSEYTFNFIKLALRCRTMENFTFCRSAPITAVNIMVLVVAAESFFEPWMAKLETESLHNLTLFSIESCTVNVKGPSNGVHCISLTHDFTHHFMREDWLRASMDYLETMDIHESFSCHREPPFYYNPWDGAICSELLGEKTTAYCFLPNSKSYVKTVTDIGKLKIECATGVVNQDGRQCESGVLDSDAEVPAQPFGMDLLDLSIPQDTLENTPNGRILIEFSF